MISEKLRATCAEMVANGSLDELEGIVERVAFNRWRAGATSDEDNASDEARMTYIGQTELLMMLKNIAVRGVE